MVPSKQHLYQTIVLPRNIATGSIHACECHLADWLQTVTFIISLFLTNFYPNAWHFKSCLEMSLWWDYLILCKIQSNVNIFCSAVPVN